MPITASVVENRSPDLTGLQTAVLKRRRQPWDSVGPNDVDPVKEYPAPPVQYDVVLSGGDAPAGHVVASARDRSWAQSVARAVGERGLEKVAEVESTIARLMALGFR